MRADIDAVKQDMLNDVRVKMTEITAEDLSLDDVISLLCILFKPKTAVSDVERKVNA